MKLYTACEKNKLKKVKELIAKGVDVNKASGKSGRTALYQAALKGHSRIVAELLHANAEVNLAKNDDKTPLLVASEKGKVNIVEMLLEAKADPNHSSSSCGTPLYVASEKVAKKNHRKIVALLLAAGGNINLTPYNANTPLCNASEKGLTDVVEEFLEAGAEINKPGAGGATPLYWACIEGRGKVVGQLLAAKADIDQATKLGGTPLLAASHKGYSKVISQLLLAKSAVNKITERGNTPLFIASRSGRRKVVRQLLLVGAKVNQQNYAGATALVPASEKGHVRVVNQLLARKADVNLGGERSKVAVYEACRGGHAEVLIALLRAKGNPDSANRDRGVIGKTALSKACSDGYTEIVKALLRAKAKPDLCPEVYGSTPLYKASHLGNLDIVSALLDAKASVNFLIDNSSQEDTPLYRAVYGKHMEVCEKLLSAKADPNIGRCSPLGQAVRSEHVGMFTALLAAKADPNIGAFYLPLITACEKNKVEMVEALLEARADVNGKAANAPSFSVVNIPINIAYSKGYDEIFDMLLEQRADVNLREVAYTATLLSSACTKQDAKLVSRLLKAKADPAPKEYSGNLPLVIASRKGNAKIVSELIFAKASVNVPGAHHQTPIYAACAGGHAAVVEMLLKEGADSNRISHSESGPLYVACGRGDIKIVEMLLQSGADVNRVLSDVSTALHNASQYGNSEVVSRLLLVKGINVNAVNEKGETALFCACKKRRDKEGYGIVRALLQAGADARLATYDEVTPLHIACLHGCSEIVRELLRAEGVEVNALTKHSADKPKRRDTYDDKDCSIKSGSTPLYAAAQNGHSETVRVLLSVEGIQVNEGKKEKEREAAASDQFTRYKREPRWDTPLFAACKRGHTEVVEELLAAKADANLSGINFDDPLYVAAEKGYSEVVSLLLAVKGINIYQVNSSLHAACVNGHKEVVTHLLEAKADCSLTEDASQDRPITLACENGHTEIVKQLLAVESSKVDHGRLYKKIEYDLYSYMDPLFLACENGNADIVDLLLALPSVRFDLKFDARPNEFDSPLCVASEKGYTRIVKALLVAGADVRQTAWANDETPLAIAVENKHVDIVLLVLEGLLKSHGGDSKDVISLFGANLNKSYAPMSLDDSFVQALEKYEVNRIQHIKNSVLTWLLCCNRLKVKGGVTGRVYHMGCLLGSSRRRIAGFASSFSIVNAVAKTCLSNCNLLLFAACRGGCVVLVQALLRADNPDEPVLKVNDRIEEYNQTPFQVACATGRPQIVSWLLQAKADVNLAGNAQTPLRLARCGGSERHRVVEQMLIEAGGIDPNDYSGLKT